MDLSYQEKSIAGTLTATLLVYGNYFTESILLWRDGLPDHGSVGRMFGTISLLVVIEVAYRIVIAIVDRPLPEDARDRLIDAKANRNAYAVLAFGVGSLIFGVLMAPWNPVPVTSFLLAQAMLAALVVAEVVKGATQLYYYRAGL